MSENAKIRFLFRKIKYNVLATTVEATKANITTESPDTVSYTIVYNHIGTAVSDLSHHISRNRAFSEVGQGEGNRNGGGAHSIYNPDGSINTGHHPNWKCGMSETDEKIVNNESARLGLGRNNNPSLNKQELVGHQPQVTIL